ncbi:Cytoskeletal protein Sojo [Ceratocystis lukuohia]|uniref:Cytoskeletal protein Sojo n=1 Tax=Ceratocystis lukuohia TaxID=2019550 RepID=A0ABR4MHX7_9PEZI
MPSVDDSLPSHRHVHDLALASFKEPPTVIDQEFYDELGPRPDDDYLEAEIEYIKPKHCPEISSPPPTNDPKRILEPESPLPLPSAPPDGLLTLIEGEYAKAQISRRTTTPHKLYTALNHVVSSYQTARPKSADVEQYDLFPASYVDNLGQAMNRLVYQEANFNLERDLQFETSKLHLEFAMAGLGAKDMQTRRRQLMRTIATHVQFYSAQIEFLEKDIAQRRLRLPTYMRLHEEHCSEECARPHETASPEMEKIGTGYCTGSNCEADDTLLWEPAPKNMLPQDAEERSKKLNASCPTEVAVVGNPSTQNIRHITYHGLKKMVERKFNYSTFVEMMDDSIMKYRRAMDDLERLIKFKLRIYIVWKESQGISVPRIMPHLMPKIGTLTEKNGNIKFLDLNRKYNTLTRTSRNYNQEMIRNVVEMYRSENQALALEVKILGGLLDEMAGESEESRKKTRSLAMSRLSVAKNNAQWQDWLVGYKTTAQLADTKAQATQGLCKFKDSSPDDNDEDNTDISTGEKLDPTANKLFMVQEELRHAKAQISELGMAGKSPGKYIALAVKRAEKILNFQHAQLLERLTYDYDRKFDDVKAIANNLRLALETQISWLTTPEAIPTITELLDQRAATRAEIGAEFQDEISRLKEDAVVREAEVESLKSQLAKASLQQDKADAASPIKNRPRPSLGTASWIKKCSVAMTLRSQNSRLRCENRLLLQRDSWISTEAGLSSQEMAENHKERINELRETYEHRELEMQSSIAILQEIVDKVENPDAQGLITRLKAMADIMQRDSQAQIKDNAAAKKEWAKALIAKLEIFDIHDTAMEGVNECIDYLNGMCYAYQKTLEKAAEIFPPIKDKAAVKSRNMAVKFMEKSYSTFTKIAKEDLSKMRAIKRYMDKVKNGEEFGITRASVYQKYLNGQSLLEDARSEAAYYKSLVLQTRRLVLEESEETSSLHERLLEITESDYASNKPVAEIHESTAAAALLQADVDWRNHSKLQSDAKVATERAFEAMREMKVKLSLSIRLRHRERLEKESIKRDFKFGKFKAIAHCLSLKRGFQARVDSLTDMIKAQAQRHTQQIRTLEIDAADARTMHEKTKADLYQANFELKLLRSDKSILDEGSHAYKEMMQLINDQALKYKSDLGERERIIADLKSAQASLTQKLEDKSRRLLHVEEQLRDVTINDSHGREALHKQVQNHVDKVKGMEMELAVAKEELIHVNHNMIDAQNSAKTQVADLLATKAENESLKADNSRLRKMTNKLQEKVDTLGDRLATEESRFEATLRSINKGMGREEMIKLAKSSDAQKFENLKEQFEKLKKKSETDILERESRIQDLEQRLSTLPEEREDLEALCNQKEDECIHLKHALNNAKESLSEYARKASQQETVVGELKEKISKGERTAYETLEGMPSKKILKDVIGAEVNNFSLALERMQRDVNNAVTSVTTHSIKTETNSEIRHQSAKELLEYFSKERSADQPPNPSYTDRDAKMFLELVSFRTMRAELASYMTKRNFSAFEKNMQRVREFLPRTDIAHKSSPHQSEISGSLMVLQGFNDLHTGNISLAMESLASAESYNPRSWESKAYKKLVAKLRNDIEAEKRQHETFPIDHMDDIHARCSCKAQIYRCRDHQKSKCGCRFLHILNPCTTHSNKFTHQVRQGAEYQRKLREQAFPMHDKMVNASLAFIKRVRGAASGQPTPADGRGSPTSSETQAKEDGSAQNTLSPDMTDSSNNDALPIGKSPTVSCSSPSQSDSPIETTQSFTHGISLADELADASDSDEESDYYDR